MKGTIWAILAVVFALLPKPTVANAPDDSLRPNLRPGSTTQAVTLALATVKPVVTVVSSPLPVLRPIVAHTTVRVVLATAGAAVRISPRPDQRPRNLVRRNVVETAVVRSQPETAVATTKRGSICGDRSIRGQALSPIQGRLRGCGVSNPVRVTAVDGVTLTQPATLNCNAAKALKRWISRSVKPAVGRLGGGVSSLKVVAHYSCRTRNSVRGAKISEHGRGNAIDIAAINLKTVSR